MPKTQDGGGGERRHGEALERAILEAAWRILVEQGFSALTYETVAERAGTSRPVLYRRWPERHHLVLATLRSFWRSHPIAVPDVGSLRGDALQFLRGANQSRVRLMTKISVELMAYLQGAGMTLKELREVLHPAGEVEPFEQMVARAVERGEIPRRARSPRRVNLPFHLFRHEVFMTLRPVPETVLTEIVDDLWLPLLR